MKSKTILSLIMASSLALVAFSGRELFAGGGATTESVGQSGLEGVLIGPSDSMYDAQISLVGRPFLIDAKNECTSDADCKSVRLSPCTAVKCVGIPVKKIDWVSDKTIGGHSVCQVSQVKDCDPCESYKDDKAAYRCCRAGFDEAVDKEEFACCRKYFGRRREMASVSKDSKSILIQEWAGRESSSFYSLYSPHEVSKDFFKWMYQKCLTRDCPSAPALDCNLFKDEATRACCAKFSDVPALAVLKCVKSAEECTNGLNIKAGEGATVNVSNFNECCQAVFNSGDISSTTVSQACSNVASAVPGSGGETAGGTTTGGTTGSSITTPSGSSSTPGAPADTGGGCSLVKTPI